eukprot:4150705-Prorocentrum_lima.AAC.1
MHCCWCATMLPCEMCAAMGQDLYEDEPRFFEWDFRWTTAVLRSMAISPPTRETRKPASPHRGCSPFTSKLA